MGSRKARRYRNLADGIPLTLCGSAFNSTEYRYFSTRLVTRNLYAPELAAGWLKDAKPTVEEAIGADFVPYPPSEHAPSRYKAVYEKIQAGLANISRLSSRRSGKA